METLPLSKSEKARTCFLSPVGPAGSLPRYEIDNGHFRMVGFAISVRWLRSQAIAGRQQSPADQRQAPRGVVPDDEQSILRGLERRFEKSCGDARRPAGDLGCAIQQ